MVKKDESATDVIDELSEEQFSQLPIGGKAGIIDYDEVWNLVKGKIVTSTGLNKAVNIVRGKSGFPARTFYYSEAKRVFEGWEAQGRHVEKRTMLINKKRRAVYKFTE